MDSVKAVSTPRSRLIDLEALAATELANEPYRWAYLPHAIRPSQAAALRATFPDTGFWHLRNHDGEKAMDFRIRALVPLGSDGIVEPDRLAAPWRLLASELLSPRYREACARALGQSLGDALLELSAWRWGPGAKLGAHVDIPRKLASQVFYFNQEWDPALGGCLRILRSSNPEDVFAELPPSLGSASLIVRSESSWHSVPPIRNDAAAERLSLVATWQHPGTASPFWTTEQDGTVWCHARGSVREDQA
jgi:hypothetical protein